MQAIVVDEAMTELQLQIRQILLTKQGASEDMYKQTVFYGEV